MPDGFRSESVFPFKEDPNASRPQKRRTREGGAARESKNETREKGNGPLAAECQRKTRKPVSDNMKTYLSAAAGKPMPMPPCVAGEYERRKIYRNRPIRALMRMMTGILFSLFRQP
jgi:hypothetical protein